MSTTLIQRATVAALIVAAIVGAVAANRVASSQLESRRDHTAREAQGRIDEALRRDTFYLEDVADMVGVHDDADEAEFSRYARVRGRNDESIVAVQWLRDSPTGELAPPRETGPHPILVPPARAEDLRLADAANAPPAAEAVQGATEDKEATASTPVEMARGDAGFYLAVPVEARRFSGEVSRLESRSAIVGIVNAQRMVTAAFAGVEEPGLELSDGDSALASHDDLDDDPITVAVDAPGRIWTLQVDGGSMTTLESVIPWLILVVGLALAGVVGWVLRGAAARRDAAMRLAGDRSEALADSLARVESANRNLEAARAEAERRSREDSLTHIFNRRHFGEVLADELARGETSPGPAVLLLDLDYFKEINDEHGHLVGDAVLQIAAQRIASVLRDSDCLARWGGEEFAVLAPRIERAEARELGERARRAIAERPIVVGDLVIRLTLSVGAAMAADGLTDPDRLVGAADRALYDAKDADRNCVRVWDRQSASTRPRTAASGTGPQ